jgi:ATPase subunit of ABC transporter with duplicated ATPase domains
LTLSETLGFAENYLVLMGWTTETASTTVDVYSTVTKNATDLYSATTRQPRRDANDVDDQFAQGWAETEAQTATLTTWDIDYRAETAGTTVRIQDAFIFVMNLDSEPPPPPAAVGYSFGFILL